MNFLNLKFQISIMKKITNAYYIGSENRKGLIDLEIPANFNQKIIVFVHGYMGFKDWGAWNLMGDFFVEEGFGFCKFNLTHNGTTVDNPLDFIDLNAFSTNSYTKEKNDVQYALDWIENQFENLPEIYLMGHSRGGGIVLLNGSDSRIHAVVTLASISSVQKRFVDSKMIDAWKKSTIRLITNQRTKQEMPHHFSQYEDFIEHQQELDIQAAGKALKKPVCIIHGYDDTSVSIEEGKEIADWTKMKLNVIENTDHVFGASHPWNSKQMPEALTKVCDIVLDFVDQVTNV